MLTAEPQSKSKAATAKEQTNDSYSVSSRLLSNGGSQALRECFRAHGGNASARFTGDRAQSELGQIAQGCEMYCSWGLPGYFVVIENGALAAKQVDAQRCSTPGGRGQSLPRLRIARTKGAAVGSIRAMTANPEFHVQPCSWCGLCKSISRSIHSPCGETQFL